MAKKPAAAPQPARLTNEEMRAAIPRLERRITELEGLDLTTLTDENVGDVVGDLQRRIDDTLVDVFGHDTTDYHRYSISWIDETPMSLVGDSPSIHERRDYIKRGVASAISTWLHP
jgi:hypothetical protein